ESEEAIDFACRLATERRSSIAAVSVVVVPLELPLDAELPEAEAAANQALDSAVAIGELYGVDVIGRLLRARSPGRAIVREAERRGGAMRDRWRCRSGGRSGFAAAAVQTRLLESPASRDERRVA